MFNVIPPTGTPFDWRFVLGSDEGDGDKFRTRLSELLGGDIYLTTSGKAALYLLLGAAHANTPHRDEVIIPDYTCWSVPSSVVKAGLKVRPVDIDKRNLGLSVESIRQAISDKTLAVVFVHLFGIPGDINVVADICREANVLLIDDAAQALGATVEGQPLGSFGDAGVLSFGRGKNITTLHGGAAVIRNQALAQAADRIYCNEFPEERVSYFADSAQLAAYKILFNRYLYWIPDSLPFLKLGEVIFDPGFRLAGLTDHRAARGCAMLAKIEEIRLGRKKRVEAYQTALANVRGIEVPSWNVQAEPAFLRFPIIFEDKQNRNHILKQGHRLGISGMYPDTVSSIETLRPDIVGDAAPCPTAADVASTLVTLPTHHNVTESDILRITELVDSASGRN